MVMFLFLQIPDPGSLSGHSLQDILIVVACRNNSDSVSVGCWLMVICSQLKVNLVRLLVWK